jgi:prefoldin alpha subunit
MMDEREAQEATQLLMDYKARFESLDEQQAILAEEARIIFTSMEQNERARVALERFSKGAKDDEVLVHLGGDVFMPGKLKDRKSVIVGVGSDIYMQMDVSKAQGVCERRIEELKGLIKQIEDGQRRFNEEKSRIASAYNALATKLEKGTQAQQKGFAA